MSHVSEPSWTFYGRQECGCCEEAANLLLLLLDGHRITVRMIDLRGPEEAPAPIHRLPALMDAHAGIVWQGAFDSHATEIAWMEASRRRARPPRPESFAPEAEPGAPIANGMQ